MISIIYVMILWIEIKIIIIIIVLSKQRYWAMEDMKVKLKII